MTPVRPAPNEADLPDKTRAMVAALGTIGRRDQTFLPNLAVTFRDSEGPPQPNRFGVPQAGCIQGLRWVEGPSST